MTDPYESGGFSGRVGYAPIDVEPDVIIITHDHLDHSHTATMPGTFEVVRHEGTPLGVPVRSVEVYHDMEQGTRFGGTIDMKIFTIAITFCRGDIGELLDDPGTSGDRSNRCTDYSHGWLLYFGPDGAAEVVKRLNPKIVIPCHYKAPRCGFDIVTVGPFLSI